MTKVLLFSDGACRGNQEEFNTGGYGALLIYGKHRKEIHGGARNTTNNIMELTGMIEGLKALKRKDISLEIYSDSAYIINAFRENWVDKWLLNGWKTASKKDVENKELWQELISLVRACDKVEFYKIKGHLSVDSASVENWYQKFRAQKEVSLDEFKDYLLLNQRVDQLANLGADEVTHDSK